MKEFGNAQTAFFVGNIAGGGCRSGGYGEAVALKRTSHFGEPFGRVDAEGDEHPVGVARSACHDVEIDEMVVGILYGARYVGGAEVGRRHIEQQLSAIGVGIERTEYKLRMTDIRA